MTATAGPEIFDGDASDELITGEAVALDVRPASFILRAGGTIIDVLVSLAIGIGLVLLLARLAYQMRLDIAAIQAFVTAIIVFVTIVVPVAVELLTRGRSLGKLAIGARIVRDDGGAIGFRHAFIRALVGFFEIYSTFGGGAALTGLLNSRAKRLGDMLAGTYAQMERVPRVKEATFRMPPMLAAWATTADVGRMPDRLSRRIAQFLKQAQHLTPASRARLAADLAFEASAYVSPVPNVDPEVFLYGVASIRRDREYAALMLERQRLQKLQPVLRGAPHGFPDR